MPGRRSRPITIDVAEDPLFEHVEALAVDEERDYAAVGEDGHRRIVVIDLR